MGTEKNAVSSIIWTYISEKKDSLEQTTFRYLFKLCDSERHVYHKHVDKAPGYL